MSKDIPEESKDKYGRFNDDLPQIGKQGGSEQEQVAAWDRACRLAAEIERKNQRESDEERLERTSRESLTDVLSLLANYR